VINTATNRITATIRVGSTPDAVAVSPAGTHIYVVNERFMTPRGSVSVITRR
jgi:DNA-binding beta-propeller fold protein YncE